MQNEKKKEYLKSYQEAKRRERILQDEIRRLRMDKMFPSVTNDGMPHGTDCSDLSDYAVRLDKVIQELKDQRNQALDRYTDIRFRIEQMSDDTEKDLLTLKYLQGLTWEQVAVEMGCTWRHVHRVHAKALNNFKMS